MRDMDSLMFEVAESSLTLRNEEWGLILTALEVAQGFSLTKPLDIAAVGLVQKRLMRRFMGLDPD